jgi:hypothetical protein
MSTQRRDFDLDAFKAKYQEKKNKASGTGTRTFTNTNYYPFWFMDTTMEIPVRFLPNKDPNDPWFMLERDMHEIPVNGKMRKIPCLKNYDKHASCPMCEKSIEFYNLEGKKSVRGGQLYRKRKYLTQALVIKDPLPANPETGEKFDGKLAVLLIGSKIYESIDIAIEDGDVEGNPVSYYNGYNFTIKQTKNGDYSDYSRSKFDRKPSELTEEQIEYVEENLVELSSLLPTQPSLDFIYETLNAFLGGNVYAVSANTDQDHTIQTSSTSDILSVNTGSRQEAPPAPVTQTAAIPVAQDDDDDETDAIIAQLKARRAKAAA